MDFMLPTKWSITQHADSMQYPPASALTPPPTPPNPKKRCVVKKKRNLEETINKLAICKFKPTKIQIVSPFFTNEEPAPKKSVRRSIFHSIADMAESAFVPDEHPAPKSITPPPPTFIQAPEMPPTMKPAIKGQSLLRHCTEQLMRKQVLNFYLQLREDILMEQLMHTEEMEIS
jgi:hypothetical protein